MKKFLNTKKLPVNLVLRLWNYVFSNTKKKKEQQPVIPMDLIVDEILCRLPVKCLLRFRCVCKSWNSLISNDPNFANKHLRLSTKCRHFIVTNWLPSKFTAMSYSLDSLQLNSSFTFNNELELFPHNLIGSCDGLLCLGINSRLALLWNPSTRKYKKLPSLEIPQEQGTTAFVFGYDPFVRNYKVVSVLCSDFESNACKSPVNIYTLGTHSWRRIQDFPMDYFYLIEPGIFVNNTVNWLACSHGSSHVIVSLDLGKESYQEIPQPDYGMSGHGTSVRIRMGMLQGLLGIFCSSESFTDVWLMKEYGNKESWINSRRLSHIIDHNYYIPNSRIVYVFKDDNHALLLFAGLFGKLMWFVYDTKNGTTKTLNIQDNSYIVDSRLYVESLVSP